MACSAAPRRKGSSSKAAENGRILVHAQLLRPRDDQVHAQDDLDHQLAVEVAGASIVELQRLSIERRRDPLLKRTRARPGCLITASTDDCLGSRYSPITSIFE